jgi:hypothetical protein
VVVVRRRPGQRAVASKDQSANAYDLANDKLVRARAKFEGLSLGESGYKYFIKPYTNLSNFTSTNVADSVDLTRNHRPTILERELLAKILHYDSNAQAISIDCNPVLANKIKRNVIRGMVSELAEAKRARHTNNVIEYVKALCSMPRYIRLSVTQDIDEHIPY